MSQMCFRWSIVALLSFYCRQWSRRKAKLGSPSFMWKAVDKKFGEHLKTRELVKRELVKRGSKADLQRLLSLEMLDGTSLSNGCTVNVKGQSAWEGAVMQLWASLTSYKGQWWEAAVVMRQFAGWNECWNSSPSRGGMYDSRDKLSHSE